MVPRAVTKYVNPYTMPNKHKTSFNCRPSLIEEIALFPSDVYIEKIHIVRVTENGRGGSSQKGQKKPKLIVLTRDQV